MSVRARMEAHRSNPVCASCHKQMDPLGFALENFTAIGKWRDTEAGVPIDASGAFPDGTTFHNPAEFTHALLGRKDQFVRTLTEKLMTYAIGRGITFQDMPAVRQVIRDAGPEYRWTALLSAIVKSAPFQAPPRDQTPTVVERARDVQQ